MSKRFLFTLLTILIIFGATGIAIFLAKGYTFSSTEKRIVGTGIISAASEPSSASVYVDGHLTTATNATISNLAPKKYVVKIIKEGFIPWEKEIEVREGLVSEVKVTLFPAIPTIYPLTVTGVKNPILSPDGSQLAYIVPLADNSTASKKAGVWVWTMSKNQPIAFAKSAEPHQAVQSTSILDFSTATLKWSPDSKKILATIKNPNNPTSPGNNYQLNSDTFSSEPRDITPVLAVTLQTWEEDIAEQEFTRVETIGDLGIKNIASNSAIVKWAPDETKFIFREKPLTEKELSGEEMYTGFKVQDIERNKVYLLPPAKLHTWLPDSEHIILVEDGKISIVDSDGTNQAVIYAGGFIDSFIFAWPDSSRLVIINSLPTPTASEPNLFGINLK